MWVGGWWGWNPLTNYLTSSNCLFVSPIFRAWSRGDVMKEGRGRLYNASPFSNFLFNNFKILRGKLLRSEKTMLNYYVKTKKLRKLTY